MINLSNFSMNNLKLDKNKPENWCADSVNPLYLMINKVFCFLGAKNGVKYLKIDKGNKKLEEPVLSLWNEVFTGIRYYIKKINHECKSLTECKGSPHCENLVKLKLIMMMILIKLDLLAMIIYQ